MSTNLCNAEYARLHPRLFVSPSKAHEYLFSRMRDVTTTSEEFVRYAKRSIRILAEDALAEFPTIPVTIQTPCGTYNGVDRLILPPGQKNSTSSSNDNNVTTQPPNTINLCAVSIVRSGDVLLEIVRDIEPSCKVGKILIQRDESSLEKLPKLIYQKLPHDIKNMYVLLCDPMLATGGSAIQALDVLCNDHGVDPSRIVFANLICCPYGLNVLSLKYPTVTIVTATIDDHLNDDKYIVPGLGDFGDRFFNTV